MHMQILNLASFIVFAERLPSCVLPIYIFIRGRSSQPWAQDYSMAEMIYY